MAPRSRLVAATRRTATCRAAGAPSGWIPFLERAEQLGLYLEAQLADLVEEQRAAVGELERAFLVGHGPGEGAPAVAEEEALGELPRQAGTVHRVEPVRGEAAQAVEVGGDQLLARPGGALDEHGQRRPREPRGPLERREEGGVPAHDAEFLAHEVSGGPRGAAVGRGSRASARARRPRRPRQGRRGAGRSPRPPADRS